MMFTNLPPYFKTFNQLSLFDPNQFLERMTSVTSSGRFSLDLVAGDTDLKELSRRRDEEVRTRAEYALKQGNSNVGDALFETGVIEVSDKTRDDPPYFERLVLRTDVPISFKSGETIPITTIKILLAQLPSMSQMIFSSRTDKTRRIGGLFWVRNYSVSNLLPTSYFFKEQYLKHWASNERRNHLLPTA